MDARPSWSCWRTRSLARFATGARTSSPSTASPASARRGSGQEFLSALEGATILSGRALPYGESITYWPLAEMVKASADIADDDPIEVAIEKLRDCCPAEAVADLLGLASGVLEAVHGERSQQEIAWAAREWATLMAGVQPLVLVFEDIHWAEEPLLELIEHLASWVREAPLLILCFARTELLDVRPGWGGGRVRATAIELEPLGSAESEELVDALLGRRRRPARRGPAPDRCSRRPRAIRSSSRRRCGCWTSTAAARPSRSPTRFRR